MEEQSEQQPHLEQSRRGEVRGLVDEIAERFTKVVSGRVIYGDPVERNGTTVIPVARVRFGFGGGMGRKREADEGRGGGGGAQISPVGFIVISNEGAHFEKIPRPKAAVVLATMLLAGWLVQRILGKRGKRR